ncbi:MAG TPA: DedA family protein, partial [Streptosporangiaceae bacterium]|nr:DedA family protein [Streptosporangiaceae bacterium]
CGLMGYPRRRFVAATACAGAVWAGYAFFLGRLGGKAFEDRPWLGLLLALGAAVAAGLLVEAGRRVMQSRQRARRPAGNGEGPSTPAPSDPHPGSAAGRYAWNHGVAAGPRPSGIEEGLPR